MLARDATLDGVGAKRSTAPPYIVRKREKMPSLHSASYQIIDFLTEEATGGDLTFN